MRDMYAYATQTAKGKFQGNAEEHDGKLHFKGTVATEAEKNEIWNAIKTIPTWQNDVVAASEQFDTNNRRRSHGSRLQHQFCSSVWNFFAFSG